MYLVQYNCEYNKILDTKNILSTYYKFIVIVLATVFSLLRADLDPAKMLLSSPPAAAVTDSAAASVLPGPAQPR